MFDFFSAETYDVIKEWLIQNPGWAGTFVFTSCACESLAVIGLFVPGLAFMTIIGFLINADVLQIIPTLSYAVLGAVVGDGISYYIGWRFKDHLPNYWPFRKHTSWLARGKEFFVKYGTLSIVIGRFVGPVRPFIPVVAGMMHMKPRIFLFANILSALVWAPIYMMPGFLLGELWFW